jgi:hypothetical protein
MNPILDPYIEKIHEHWDKITGMYMVFEDKKPIIEFDPNRLRIITYPAQEYIDSLSDRTREKTRRQYREAIASGALMIFVRDEKKEVLRS